MAGYKTLDKIVPPIQGGAMRKKAVIQLTCGKVLEKDQSEHKVR